MTAEMMFDYMGILLDKEAMADKDITINVNLSDENKKYMLRIKNGPLLYMADEESETPDITLTCPKNALFYILSNNKEGAAKTIKIEGDTELMDTVMDSMNQLDLSSASNFNIVEP